MYKDLMKNINRVVKNKYFLNRANMRIENICTNISASIIYSILTENNVKAITCAYMS